MGQLHGYVRSEGKSSGLALALVKKIGGGKGGLTRLATAFVIPLGFFPLPKFRGRFSRELPFL